MTNNVTCAIIPARGGSKGVPRKNLRSVGGVPLVERAIKTLRRVRSIDYVVVTTDDPEIALVAEYAGALVVARPEDISGDTASSESAVVHALNEIATRNINPDITVLVQATSPFIREQDVERAITKVTNGQADVVFSVVPTDAFLWRDTEDGMRGINHDWSNRPRRQEREEQLQETGAFYVMRTAGFRTAGYRFFGRVAGQVVPTNTALEIDTLDDLAMARNIAGQQNMVVEHPSTLDIDALVMDFDGVHTDNLVHVDQTGRETVTVSRSDGMAIAMLKRYGLPMLILSTEVNPVVAQRGQKLGVEVVQGSQDKATDLSKWLGANHLDAHRVAYVGNDINDLNCFELVGWPLAVADAALPIKTAARVILQSSGGHGAIREIADVVAAKRKEAIA